MESIQFYSILVNIFNYEENTQLLNIYHIMKRNVMQYNPLYLKYLLLCYYLLKVL